MTTEMTDSPVTALTPPQRAAVALDSAKHRKDLAELVKKSANIVAVLNSDAREEAHRAAMVLKNTRVAIQKRGKEAREDATAFSKAVIAEEKALIDMIEPEESRVLRLRDKWDADREAERQVKIAAERKRVDDISARISNIAHAWMAVANKSSAVMGEAMLDLSMEQYTEEAFQEFLSEAERVRSGVLTKLNEMIAAKEAEELEAIRIKREQEAEAARLKAEREELAKLREEAATRRAEEERIAAGARAAQEAELAEARRKQEAELAAQRAEIARQQAERDAEAAKQAKEVREAQEAAQALIAAEQERLRMERAAFEREQAEIAEAKRLQEEAEAARIAAIAKAEEEEAERVRLQAAAEQMLTDAKTEPVPVVWPFPVDVKPAHQPERVLTLVITIKDVDAAKWIWGAHVASETFHGVQVDAIYEGDALSEIDRLREELEQTA